MSIIFVESATAVVVDPSCSEFRHFARPGIRFRVRFADAERIEGMHLDTLDRLQREGHARIVWV